VDLCLDDPGSEIDLYLTATLRDMIYLRRGDLPLARALESGRLEAVGSARAVRVLPRWLGIPALAKVRSMREDAEAA
jgi:hypothetical protein